MGRRRGKRATTDAWAGHELPNLDERLCTGCKLCVAICPTDCLEMAGPLPWLPRPGACVSCSACVLVCPAKALRMENCSASA
ncbi:MAG: 4Fe-4S binding protein [Planctomycetes bacterium]|nr:4Fe-4S binding protein [Planctomycetota bacterium]